MNLTVAAPAARPRADIWPERVRARWPSVHARSGPGGFSPQHAVKLLEQVEALISSVRQARSATDEDDRSLLTLMFTDIVDSSGLVQRLGDEAWAELLGRHHAVVRTQLTACRGREIDTAGDGFFASFDTPARAVRCAMALRSALQAMGIVIRIGLHTGECERLGNKVAGLAVHVAARIAARAAAGEIAVSGTVRDLVMGSGLRFVGGEWHALKGLREEWRLYRVSCDERAVADRQRPLH